MKEFVMLNVLLISTMDDIKNYKISNGIIISGLLSGLLLNVFDGIIKGFFHSLISVVAAVSVLWIFFHIRGIGAGDVKLFAVTAVIYGLLFVGKMFMWLIVIAGAESAWKVVRHPELLGRFSGLYRYIMYSDHSSKYYEPKRDGRLAAVRLAPLTSVAYFITMLQYAVK